MSKEITKAEYVNYLRMALALSGISIDKFTAEIVIDTWGEIQKKGGQFNISDSARIEWRLRKKYQRVKAVYEKKQSKK